MCIRDRIVYYNDPLDQPGANGPAEPIEYEMYDLVADPYETVNLWDAPGSKGVQEELLAELARMQEQTGDIPYVP